MDLQLNGKVVVVTAASKGIGLAIARAFAAEGAIVVAGARNTSSLAGISGVTPVAVDLSTPEGPGQLLAQALEKHDRVDVLVNNLGGVRLRLNGFLGTSDEEFAWSMNLNFFSTVRATRAAITHMVGAGGGSIVNVCSVNAFFQPDAGTIDYGPAKAAMLNLNKSLAQEFGSKGIRVNAVSPGPVSTELWLGENGVSQTVARATGLSPEKAREQVIASIGGLATGQFTTPEQVADLVLFLASARAGNVTGSNFVIDGGLLKTL
jgi:NAD(P)-dependent dehydrogenase (short-subunit alcohol dehydrogenase family)